MTVDYLWARWTQASIRRRGPRPLGTARLSRSSMALTYRKSEPALAQSGGSLCFLRAISSAAGLVISVCEGTWHYGRCQTFVLGRSIADFVSQQLAGNLSRLLAF